jgi:hypothetical protein
MPRPDGLRLLAPVTGGDESAIPEAKAEIRGTDSMADQKNAHQHGSMDIRAQEKTFAGFIRMSIWVAAISIAILVFAALANA